MNIIEVVRTYDHEILGRTIVRPVVGNGGLSDAAVVRVNDVGVAIGIGFNHYPDPYKMAIRAVDEAVRNVVSVGADPARIALVDNFCWGNVSDPWDLIKAVDGMCDAARIFKLPFVAGKDSLNNTFKGRSIPRSLMITALGLIPDVSKCITMDAKRAGNCIYVVGRLRDYPDPETCRLLHNRVSEIYACHDISSGGMYGALVEMLDAGELSLDFEINLHINQVLSCFLVEADPDWDFPLAIKLGTLV